MLACDVREDRLSISIVTLEHNENKKLNVWDNSGIKNGITIWWLGLTSAEHPT